MTKSTFDTLFSTKEDGVEIFMGTNKNGTDVFFTIAESGNPNHEKAQRKYAKQLEAARKQPKKEHWLMSKIMAEAIVTNWRGVIDEKGKEIPCTLENKIDAFNRHKKLFYAVLKEATNEDNFRDFDDFEGDFFEDDDVYEEPVRDTEKNSKKS